MSISAGFEMLEVVSRILLTTCATANISLWKRTISDGWQA